MATVAFSVIIDYSVIAAGNRGLYGLRSTIYSLQSSYSLVWHNSNNIDMVPPLEPLRASLLVWMQIEM